MKTIKQALSGLGATVAVAGILFSGSAGAALITSGGLTLDTAPGATYDQQSDSPCVIGGNDCNNPVLDYTLNGSGGAGTEEVGIMSPVYSLTSIYGVLNGGTPTAFFIGLDYNDTSTDQILRSFMISYYSDAGTTSTGSQTYTGPTSLKTIYNGVGFSDFLITGIVIPGSTTHIMFTASWFNNDGPDSYFLIKAGAPPSVPTPGTLALLGLGAAALGFAAKRRRTS